MHQTQGQASEAWEPEHSNSLSAAREHWIEKHFHAVFIVFKMSNDVLQVA